MLMNHGKYLEYFHGRVNATRLPRFPRISRTAKLFASLVSGQVWLLQVLNSTDMCGDWLSGQRLWITVSATMSFKFAAADPATSSRHLRTPLLVKHSASTLVVYVWWCWCWVWVESWVLESLSLLRSFVSLVSCFSCSLVDDFKSFASWVYTVVEMRVSVG